MTCIAYISTLFHGALSVGRTDGGRRRGTLPSREENEMK